MNESKYVISFVLLYNIEQFYYNLWVTLKKQLVYRTVAVCIGINSQLSTHVPRQQDTRSCNVPSTGMGSRETGRGATPTSYS